MELQVALLDRGRSMVMSWPLPGGGASVSVGVECLDGKDL